MNGDTWPPISLSSARELVDFGATRSGSSFGHADLQLRGAVAIHNMLARNRIAYLADEVGLGKTYVALGVLGLVRHLNPDAKAMIIAPRENIQRKWLKEYQNFVRGNWRVDDHRVRNLQSGPVRPPIACQRLEELAFATMRHGECDPVLRMTSFSIDTTDKARRDRHLGGIRRHARWLLDETSAIGRVDFVTRLGIILNGLIPEIDLLIVDEAHNLRHGLGPRPSTRNRLLATALGTAPPEIDLPSWYGPRAKRVLLLSATPFEADYADIHRQLEVLGHGDAQVGEPASAESPMPVRLLTDPTIGEDRKRACVRRFLLRRVGSLQIAGKPHTRNMYRREWRCGGYTEHDLPMRIEDERTRLAVALVQKKVAEILGDERFKNIFQIGMLSSFESFFESFRRRQASGPGVDELDEAEHGTFDGADQTQNLAERQGVDTESVARLNESHRLTFGRPLPHPKLDVTADAFQDAFETGEKTLIFVRRVATVAELKRLLDDRFDNWIENRMLVALPDQKARIGSLFKRYRLERRRDTREQSNPTSPRHSSATSTMNRDQKTLDDVGATDSFFAWFFRGEGPPDVLSGAAMQRNRFGGASSRWGTVFADDLVSWLLGDPEDVLADLARACELRQEELVSRLRRLAFAHFARRTGSRDRFPRLYVHDAYQAAAMSMLSRMPNDLGRRAGIVQAESMPDLRDDEATPLSGFPGPESVLGASTFFTALRRRTELANAIWPEDSGQDWRETFRRREQRRELISASCRLGLASIDLYLAAIQTLGSMELHTTDEQPDSGERLVDRFLTTLEIQRRAGTFGACAELQNTADAFDTIVNTNFPELPETPLHGLPELYARTLSHQAPVAGMSGGVNHRLVRQFRMPGFPMLLISTDVLQEGEDLHTACRRVVHYGIAWTPSAVEQRNGRVDRIGSLAQRRLDGRTDEPPPEELIQVHFPHLSDTIEAIQVRRVHARMNDFLRLSHRDLVVERESESQVHLDAEMLEDLAPIPQYRELLRSAFDSDRAWLEGDTLPPSSPEPSIESLERWFATLWRAVEDRFHLDRVRAADPRHRSALATVIEGELARRTQAAAEGRRQQFELALQSRIGGSDVLLRCRSTVGRVDLSRDSVADRLLDLQRQLGDIRLCIRPAGRQSSDLSVENARLFRPDITQTDEVIDLVAGVTVAADTIEAALLGTDRIDSEEEEDVACND